MSIGIASVNPVARSTFRGRSIRRHRLPAHRSLFALTLRDRDQKPVTGARLRLEGLMSHPGMAPVTAAVTERGNGEYEAPLQFTMAGDWILLVTGELPGGMGFKRQIEINGVRPGS